MKRAAPIIVLVVLAVALLIIKRCKNNSSSSAEKPRSSQTPAGDVNRDHGFDRRVSYLQYSEHAKCRMACRHISQEEVEETMRDGKINYKKSDVQSRSPSGARCPRYALEEVTKDNQRVRIVFAQCNNYTEVVTVIDLDTEWSCDCPGDDEKYQNRNR